MCSCYLDIVADRQYWLMQGHGPRTWAFLVVLRVWTEEFILRSRCFTGTYGLGVNFVLYQAKLCTRSRSVVFVWPPPLFHSALLFWWWRSLWSLVKTQFKVWILCRRNRPAFWTKHRLAFRCLPIWLDNFVNVKFSVCWDGKHRWESRSDIRL